MDCCETCLYCFPIEKWDYTRVKQQGVTHRKMDGYICVFLEGECAVWKVGVEPSQGMCECFVKKTEPNSKKDNYCHSCGAYIPKGSEQCLACGKPTLQLS